MSKLNIFITLILLAIFMFPYRTVYSLQFDCSNPKHTGYLATSEGVYAGHGGYCWGIKGKDIYKVSSDPDSFEIFNQEDNLKTGIGSEYGKDGERIFFGGKHMVGVDADSFGVLTKTTAYDNQHIYISGKIVAELNIGNVDYYMKFYRDRDKNTSEYIESLYKISGDNYNLIPNGSFEKAIMEPMTKKQMDVFHKTCETKICDLSQNEERKNKLTSLINTIEYNNIIITLLITLPIIVILIFNQLQILNNKGES